MREAQFAHYIGKTVRTVARYESALPIGWDALVELAQLADQQNRPDLAEALRGALGELVGGAVTKLLRESIAVLPQLPLIIEGIEQAERVVRDVDVDHSPVAELVGAFRTTKEIVNRLKQMVDMAGLPDRKDL